MEIEKLGVWTYLTIDIMSLAFPFAYSFTARSGFIRQWRRILLALFVSATPFLIWDSYFTLHGIWSFNPAYTLGWSWVGLPLEEILFFVCIPFACLFIYDIVKKFPRLHLPEKPTRWIANLLGIVCLSLAIVFWDRAYTVTAFSTAMLAFFAIGLGLLRENTGAFATTYLFHLIPFFLVNGLLTSIPVVLYNNAENLGMRITTIPVEDAFYSLTLLFLNVAVLERAYVRRH